MGPKPARALRGLFLTIGILTGLLGTAVVVLALTLRMPEGWRFPWGVVTYFAISAVCFFAAARLGRDVRSGGRGGG